MSHRSAIIVFLVATLTLAAFLLFAQMTNRQIQSNASSTQNQSEQETVNEVLQQNEDPFVTVVPKGVVGGKPQPLDTDPQHGAQTPTVIIVEFGDFECEACAIMAPFMKRIIEAYPNDVLHVWKDYPIPALHPYSEQAALAARCAQSQGRFWEYHDVLFEKQDLFILSPWNDIASTLKLDSQKFSTCMEKKEKEALVVQGYYIGKTLEIAEAPTYYINDQVLHGIQSYETLTTLIDNEISNANKK
ncbi:MAG TPA: thioredoxin domain-containing protein [Patescibacteria group bacterium]|nr:thioredoxin domain-containing protein [Patescibacteria group bacterium]